MTSRTKRKRLDEKSPDCPLIPLIIYLNCFNQHELLAEDRIERILGDQQFLFPRFPLLLGLLSLNIGIAFPLVLHRTNLVRRHKLGILVQCLAPESTTENSNWVHDKTWSNLN